MVFCAYRATLTENTKLLSSKHCTNALADTKRFFFFLGRVYIPRVAGVCSGFFWPGRHSTSLYLSWMTQSTSKCRFITCSCCPSSVPLCRWHWKDLSTRTPPMPFYPCAWLWLPLWRCCLCLLQRWEFYGWKPIIYTCDYRSVWLNCISFIIPY